MSIALLKSKETKERNISPKKMPWPVVGCLHTLTAAKRPSVFIMDAFPQHPHRLAVGVPRGSPPTPTRCLQGGRIPAPLEKQPEDEAGPVPAGSQMGQSSKVGQLGEAALPLQPHCPLLFPQPQRGEDARCSASRRRVTMAFPCQPRPLGACCCTAKPLPLLPFPGACG